MGRMTKNVHNTFSPDYHIGNQLRPTDSDEFKRLIQIFHVGGKWFQNNTYDFDDFLPGYKVENKGED